MSIFYNERFENSRFEYVITMNNLFQCVLFTKPLLHEGIYYWNNAQRIDEVQVKMETSDDEQVTSIISRGGKEDLERFSSTLNLPERGKVYVKGIFDGGNVDSELAERVSVMTKESLSVATELKPEEVGGTPLL